MRCRSVFGGGIRILAGVVIVVAAPFAQAAGNAPLLVVENVG